MKEIDVDVAICIKVMEENNQKEIAEMSILGQFQQSIYGK